MVEGKKDSRLGVRFKKKEFAPGFANYFLRMKKWKQK